MSAFPVETLEAEMGRFLRERAHREWRYRTGAAPGRALRSLYEADFPSFSSKDLATDLADAAVEPAARKARLRAALLSAGVEGRTWSLAARLARVEGGARIALGEGKEDLPWREGPRRWLLSDAVATRHELHERWRQTTRTAVTPTLQRWVEALAAALADLAAGATWLEAWPALLGLDVNATSRLAETLLEHSDGVYGSTVAVYLGQLGLPAQDAWAADGDWAFRAPRFDPWFAPGKVMPTAVRAFRDLGIEIEGQAGLQLDVAESSAGGVGAYVETLDAPHDVRVSVGLVGGYLDYQAALRGLGEAQHALHTDPTLPFHERQPGGDDTPTRASGLLMEGLTRDRTWLLERVALDPSDDYRVIATLGWARRVRETAALVLHTRAAWTDPSAGGLAADYADRLSAAGGVRHFPEPYLLPLREAPWRPLDALVSLRAEVFAAHLRAYLRAEFDEQWWRNRRAGRFLVEELWRPGRRHSTEALLGFMAYEGLDVRLLWEEMRQVLATV